MIGSGRHIETEEVDRAFAYIDCGSCLTRLDAEELPF